MAGASSMQSEELEHFAHPGDFLQFHHVQAYVRVLQPISEYRRMEAAVNNLTKLQGGKVFGLGKSTKAHLAEEWKRIAPDFPDPRLGGGLYNSAAQDLVEQLILGAGWRVTGYAETPELRAVVLQSDASRSAKFVVAAPRQERRDSVPAAAKAEDEALLNGMKRNEALGVADCWNFSHKAMKQFFDCHNDRQGVGILAFEIASGGPSGGIQKVYENYLAKHPNLLTNSEGPVCLVNDGEDVFITLEVYAFYKPGSAKEADFGTVIQFIEKRGPNCSNLVLPFFNPCQNVEFDKVSMPVFPDHWVSNVVNREQYLSTLSDVLGFEPKVNFNAGVVAAGEAIIESTVTGNSPSTDISGSVDLLENQQQIYLPINNSLSEFGHVHFFIQEVGQGVQHIANRCADLVNFIQRANDIRQITGRGFAFLSIPRSYYGYLKVPDLVKATGNSVADCQALFAALVMQGVIDSHGIAVLDVDAKKVKAACATAGFGDSQEEHAKEERVFKAVELSRYNHLTELLGDRLPTSELLRIVRNEILIDIQGKDILYQIFTRCILQDRPNDEAPFLEFIQRVCHDGTELTEPVEGEEQVAKKAKGKPGCGGFGIRNFLTLFLSIEVSKALRMREQGQREQNQLKELFADKMVAALTEQLNVSNPILTSISDAMTRIEELKEEIETLPKGAEKRAAIEEEIESQNSAKTAGNLQLQQVSDKYKNELRRLRGEYKAASQAAEKLQSTGDGAAGATN